ncbi:MAG: sigma-54 dependent transcriptional regulator [bacterium]
MKVLYAGTETYADECCGWVTDALPAKVSMCFDPATLLLRITTDAPDLLLVDLRKGIFQLEQTLTQANGHYPDIPIFVISPSDQVDDAVFAFQSGATDYMSVPIDRLSFKAKVLKIRHATNLKNTASGIREYSHSNPELSEDIPEELLFGSTPIMQDFRQIVYKIRDTDLPIFISGDSGTGKERTAQYIWKNSSRRDKPFVKVNCAAIPSELLESELFGFEQGAFTGAFRKKPGKFEAANRGILFLDEITDLPFPLQSKLLHVLQDGKFSTLGSTIDVSVDVRVIAATNKVIEDAVAEGAFRRDLYYRLNVVRLHVPALKDRAEQIQKLIDYFRNKYSILYNRPALNLSEDTMSRLRFYSWPGNIRELENLIRRATVLGEEKAITSEMLDNGWVEASPVVTERSEERHQTSNLGSVNEATSTGRSLKEIAKAAALEAEKEVIAKVLGKTRWNRKQAAKILDISYKTLLTKIKETGLDHA